MTSWRKPLLVAASLLVAFYAIVFVITHTVVRIYRIPTGAMAPAIDAGDAVIVKPTQDVKRGDIIAFDYPLQPKTTFLKRVIAMPGETVQIKGKRVFINGTELSEKYAVHEDDQVYPDNPSLPEPYRSRDWFGPFTVPTDQYFTMGDNRDRSSDSRYWGPVPRKNLRGVVIDVISPRKGLHKPV